LFSFDNYEGQNQISKNMCGRFTQTAKPEQIENEFKVGKLNPQIFAPRYNIAPTQMIPAVRVQDAGR
jgi:putative SOS response-associated peptidase YedK